MKNNKFLYICLICILCLFNFNQVTAFNKLNLDVKNYCVYDVGSKRFLDCPSQNVKIYPASITKLAVAMLAYDIIPSNTVIEVGLEIQKTPKYSSIMGLSYGDKVNFNDLMAGFIIASGNDAGNVLAVNIARIFSNQKNLTYDQAMPIFLSLLTDKLNKIGTKATSFVNAHGFYDPDHYTTADDLIKIALAAIEYPEIKKLSSLKKYNSESGKWSFNSHNEFLLRNKYAKGLKTGFVNESGYNLLGFAKNQGQELIFLVYGAKSKEGRYQAANDITNYYFNNYNQRSIPFKYEWLVSNGDIGSSQTINIDFNLESLSLSNDEATNLRIEYNFDDSLLEVKDDILTIKHDLYANEKVGSYTIYNLDKVVMIGDMTLVENIFVNNILGMIKYYLFRYWYLSLIVLIILMILFIKSKRKRKRARF